MPPQARDIGLLRRLARRDRARPRHSGAGDLHALCDRHPAPLRLPSVSNTYKPLLARTLVDFWNRYYDDFKELLVEFFFFPTYLNVFKRRPRLRIFAATLAAAGVGNIYYHLLRDSRELFFMPRGEAASRVASRALYSLLLSLGIFFSMLREKERRGKPSPAEDGWAPYRRLRAIAGVWLFFSLLHVWSIAPVEIGFEKRARFFWSLFGL